MKIEYLHASKFGNGAMVAAEFQKQMAVKGVAVEIHHIRKVRPVELPRADLYVFSSPGRMGKPIGRMRRFLKKVKLPAGTPYAILTTEAMPKPDERTGRMPTEEEEAKYQRVRPIMNELLQAKGLVKQVFHGAVDVANRSASSKITSSPICSTPRLCPESARSQLTIARVGTRERGARRQRPVRGLEARECSIADAVESGFGQMTALRSPLSAAVTRIATNSSSEPLNVGAWSRRWLGRKNTPASARSGPSAMRSRP